MGIFDKLKGSQPDVDRKLAAARGVFEAAFSAWTNTQRDHAVLGDRLKELIGAHAEMSGELASAIEAVGRISDLVVTDETPVSVSEAFTAAFDALHRVSSSSEAVAGALTTVIEALGRAVASNRAGFDDLEAALR